jgi:diketogulonate reductase-like aldo/keto reductase
MACSPPRIIYGTAWKKGATKDLVVRAVLRGFTAVDTACQPKHYNEAAVGDALHELSTLHAVDRASLFVQTKCTVM